MGMNEIADVANLIRLLKQLPEEKQIEFFYMIKGAALLAKKSKSA